MTDCDHDIFGIVRIAVIGKDKYLFRATDVGSYLYETSKLAKDAIGRHVENDHKIMLKNKNFRGEKNTPLKLNNFGAMFLTEAGLYDLILHSKKKKAKKFQEWLTEDVIPSIRKDGTYDIKTSSKKKKKSAFELLNLKPDKKFQEKVTMEISNIAKAKKMLKGKVWQEFKQTYNILFHSNLMMKKNEFIKRLESNDVNMREYLDLSDSKDKAMIVFAYMKLDKNLDEYTLTAIEYLFDFGSEEFSDDVIDKIHHKAKKLYKDSWKYRKNSKKLKTDSKGNLVIKIGF